MTMSFPGTSAASTTVRLAVPGYEVKNGTDIEAVIPPPARA
jgi:hypothetical protein